MQYIGSFNIKKSDYDYYKKLLDIEDLSDSDIGKENDYIGIASVPFDNGNYITIDLASGSTNYYDNVCLYDKDGNELCCSDCTYDIDGFSLFYGDDIYDIKMIIDNEVE